MTRIPNNKLTTLMILLSSDDKVLTKMKTIQTHSLRSIEKLLDEKLFGKIKSLVQINEGLISIKFHHNFSKNTLVFSNNNEAPFAVVHIAISSDDRKWISEQMDSICKVKFIWPYNSNAKQVLIAGTFNNWNPKKMKKKGDIWVKKYPLVLRKEYQYKFIVDGKWIVDEKKPVTSDASGNINNSIIKTLLPSPLPNWTIDGIGLWYQMEDALAREDATAIKDVLQRGMTVSLFNPYATIIFLQFSEVLIRILVILKDDQTMNFLFSNLLDIKPSSDVNTKEVLLAKYALVSADFQDFVKQYIVLTKDQEKVYQEKLETVKLKVLRELQEVSINPEYDIIRADDTDFIVFKIKCPTKQNDSSLVEEKTDSEDQKNEISNQSDNTRQDEDKHNARNRDSTESSISKTSEGNQYRQQPSSWYNKSYALIIGIDGYEDKPLTGAVNDANAIHELLKTCGYEATTLSEDQAKTSIDEIKRISNRIEDNDCLLVYFAGHSHIDDSKTWNKFLLQTTGNPISVKKLVDKMMNRTFPDHFLLILDTCFSEKAIEVLRAIINHEMNSSDGKHMQKTMEVLASCGTNETARENNRRGIYTQAFESAVKTKLENFVWTHSGLVHSDIEISIPSSQTPKRTIIFGGNPHRFKKSPTIAPVSILQPSKNEKYLSLALNRSEVKFIWPHGGKSVFIAGSFTDWRQIPMIKRDDGTYYISVELPLGVHQYKFIVDEQWMHDVTKPIAEDGNGNTNNVIINFIHT
jgi:hypothetical protein